MEESTKSYRILTILVGLSLLMAMATIVRAGEENPPESDEQFNLNTNLNNIPVGTQVTATASTNAPDVRVVVFMWYDPHGHLDHTEIKTLNGLSVSSSFTPDEVGTWRIKAVFAEADRDCEFELEVRRTNLFVVPEVQFGILVGLFGALGIFMLKGKSRPILKP
jgi:hypothetical protein